MKCLPVKSEFFFSTHFDKQLRHSITLFSTNYYRIRPWFRFSAIPHQKSDLTMPLYANTAKSAQKYLTQIYLALLTYFMWMAHTYEWRWKRIASNRFEALQQQQKKSFNDEQKPKWLKRKWRYAFVVLSPIDKRNSNMSTTTSVCGL